ncbi:MAG: glycoside hydrolase family 97 protein [Muribaculaceae bacterium]|nr:glycoside hydrolase family 97 protein [Muribaculaceae bacterium]
MNKLLYIAAPAVFMLASCAGGPQELSSPSGNIKLNFRLTDAGQPEYSVTFDGEEIVCPSTMGFELVNGENIAQGFKVDKVTRTSSDSYWVPVWGENDSIRDNYNAMTVAMTDKSGVKMDIEFRVFDDGAAFRYIFPEQATKTIEIKEELSEFAMGGDYTAWWIPGDYDTQEYEYNRSKLSEIRSFSEASKIENVAQTGFSPTGVQTSLMLKTPSGKYLNLHEAALVDYPAMHLNLNDTTMVFTSWLTPGRGEAKAVVNTPFKTPWRVIMASEKATGILATDIIYNLNEPNALEDVSWIHPTKYMGVWWEMITGKTSWSYTDAHDFDLATFDYSKAKPNGTHGATTENVKRYIDFAAENGFDELLIEGWNVGWEDWFGKEKDYVFDFVTPYPDFDIEELNNYAHSKGIKLMMHHETSGSIPNYEKHMDAAYDLMNKYGYDAVKSGYVGHILPKGETHYSQWTNNHYLNAIKKAAEKKIMVNAHEAVRPTGLARTYPNLVGNESAMGTEYRNMKPSHEAILPFTRLKGGPMDFTPGIFTMDLSEFVPGSKERKLATVANQLALYVTMYSPLQMAADLPENYAKKMDAFKFIKDVPVDWSKTIYIDAEPAEYIIAARKAKGGDSWWVGGIADEKGKDYDLKLDFLDPDRVYTATIYADAPDAHYLTNPEAYVITTTEVRKGDTIPLRMAPGGGVAISIE